MKRYLMFLSFFCMISLGNILNAHSVIAEVNQLEHPATEHSAFVAETNGEKIIHWLGYLHPVMIHFPIALVLMTVISEILFLFTRNPLFDGAARFMIIAAAITALPTALFGLALSYGAHYQGDYATIFFWHEVCGIITVFFAIIAAILREKRKMGFYYLCLAILFLSVNIGGYLGGEMTWGLGHMAFPI